MNFSHSTAARRRTQRTRCQRALAEMDAQYKRQRFGGGTVAADIIGAKTTEKPSVQLDIKQTSKILECPVCLEVAWPPKKIYQCMQGHIICEKCRSHPQLANCPMCRQVLSAKLVSRNLALENLAVSLSQQKKISDAAPSAPTLEDIVEAKSANEDSETVTVQVEIEDSVAIESHEDNAPLTVILPPEAAEN